MKYLEISVGKSINPNTGEEWMRCDAKVSVDESEIPEDVFKKVKCEINRWLPNPFGSHTQSIGLEQNEETLESMIEKINACTSYEGKDQLKSWSIVSTTHPKLKEAFESKLKVVQK